MPVDQNDLVVGPVVPAGGVTVISLDFFFEEAAWLQVYRGASETPLVLGADYTVAGEGTNTGSITLTVAANGTDPYAVYLKVPAERSTDLQIRGGLGSQPLNTELDRIIQMIQGLQTQIERTLRISRTSLAVPPLAAPDAASRDNAVLGFDATGLNLVLLDDVMRLADLQNQIATFGNVPAPTAAQIGRFLRATGVGVFAWQLVAAVEALAALTPAADRYPFFTDASTAALGVITALARQLLDDPDQTTMRGTLGLSAASILPVVGESLGILANDNDSGLPTPAAVRDFLDAYIGNPNTFWSRREFSGSAIIADNLITSAVFASGSIVANTNTGNLSYDPWPGLPGVSLRSAAAVANSGVKVSGPSVRYNSRGAYRFRARVRLDGSYPYDSALFWIGIIVNTNNNLPSKGIYVELAPVGSIGPATFRIRPRQASGGQPSVISRDLNANESLIVDIELPQNRAASDVARVRVWAVTDNGGKPGLELLIDDSQRNMHTLVSGDILQPAVITNSVIANAAAQNMLQLHSMEFGVDNS